MRGDFELARELIGEGRQTIADLGFPLVAAATAQEAFYVEMLAGDTAEALRIMRESYAVLEQMGERSYLSTAAALLAHALCAEDQLVEADRLSRTSEGAAARDDAFSQVLWRSARAKIRAHAGDLAEAEELGRDAVARANETDFLNTQGNTRADSAEVLALAGRPLDAVAALEQAAELFEQKGNTTSLERVRRSARELGSSARHG
jgi:ATP/maltotriose-dependent transcriptional regulator MalT